MPGVVNDITPPPVLLKNRCRGFEAQAWQFAAISPVHNDTDAGCELPLWTDRTPWVLLGITTARAEPYFFDVMGTKHPSSPPLCSLDE
jgi:hypothetical protein